MVSNKVSSKKPRIRRVGHETFRKVLEAEKPRTVFAQGWWFFMDDGPLGHFSFKAKDGSILETLSRAPEVSSRGVIKSKPFEGWSVLDSLPYREKACQRIGVNFRYVRFKRR